MSLELRRIRSFRAVAEHGGFRAAAEALGISQPTLSAHIAELEAELRVPLVARTTRQVRLTPMGERFLVHAKRALDELENAALELRDQAALERGRVIVTCTPTMAANAVPAAIAAFRDRYPGISVEVIDDTSVNVERRVLEGAADLGIAPKPDRPGGLSYQSLTSDRFVAVFPTRADLPAADTVRLRDLAAERIVSVTAGTSLRTSVERAFAEIGIDHEPAYEVHHHWTVLAFVAAGLGVGIVPETAIAPGRSDLRVCRVVEPEIARDIGLLLRRGEKLSPPAAKFVGALKQAMARARQARPVERRPGPAPAGPDLPLSRRRSPASASPDPA
jgi:LysR family carnitine catabolism transcriptional activator